MIKAHRPRREKRRENRTQRARVERLRTEREEKRDRRRQQARDRDQRQRDAWSRSGEPSPEITTAPTCEGRYADRLAAFREAFGDQLGERVHRAAWLAHNCIAHPLLGISPSSWAVRLHDQTADWLNLRLQPVHSPMPDVRAPWAWLLHNCVAHPLIGLFPEERWFAFHDATAERLGVDGWL